MRCWLEFIYVCNCVCLHETVFLATRACLYVRACVCCVWIFAIVCLSQCVTVCAVCLSVCACECTCGFVCVCVCMLDGCGGEGCVCVACVCACTPKLHYYQQYHAPSFIIQPFRTAVSTVLYCVYVRMRFNFLRVKL